MEIQGKIITALPERSGTSARGNQWRSITYVLETQERYPRKVAFDVVNDNISKLNIQVGEVLTVKFDIDAREYNQKWFNSIQAWDVQRMQPQGFQPQPTQQAQQAQVVPPYAQNAQVYQQPQQPAQQQAPKGKDDLPF